MTVHICRDFETWADAMQGLANAQLMSYFLSGVLGFTIIGSSNSPTWPLAMADTIFASGHSGTTGASINLGSGSEYHVQVPSGSHTVSANYVGYILALRSEANPRHNSGLFRITTASVGDNSYIIDYRSTDYPPAETGSLNWILYQSESRSSHNEAVFSGNGSGSAGWNTFGSATYPRMLMQSPDPSGWQVRIEVVSFADHYTAGFPNNNTFSVGIEGNAAGDWSVGGNHSHGPLWWNSNDFNSHVGQCCGLDPNGSSNWTVVQGQWRVYIWGDDQTGTTMMINRNVTSAGSGICAFGLPESEVTPHLSNVAQRVFVFGQSSYNDAQGPNWKNGTGYNYYNVGQTLGISGKPCSVVFDAPTKIFSDQAPRDYVTIDNAVLQATELIPVDIIAGTRTTQYIEVSYVTQGIYLSFEPRRMGYVPMARLGRSNYGAWSLSSDVNLSWFHSQNGWYMPWSGPTLLP